MVICATLLSICVGVSRAQHYAAPTERYHRLVCLVHLTGAGTAADPVRPEYLPGPADKPSRSGILAWSVQLSDNGRMAIVEYVAIDRHAFQNILADTRPEVLIFEIGKTDRRIIETALQVFKKGFTLESMQLPVE